MHTPRLCVRFMCFFPQSDTCNIWAFHFRNAGATWKKGSVTRSRCRVFNHPYCSAAFEVWLWTLQTAEESTFCHFKHVVEAIAQWFILTYVYINRVCNSSRWAFPGILQQSANYTKLSMHWGRFSSLRNLHANTSQHAAGCLLIIEGIQSKFEKFTLRIQ